MKRLLYVTQSAGFAHPVLPLSEAVVAQLGAASGAFAVTVKRDVSTLTAAELASFDAVAFFTSGSLPFSPAQKQALLDFVASGRGFIGLHSATDTFYDWPEYGALVGGYFDGHPWTEAVDVVVEDSAHPASAGLAPRFRIDDEIYQFRAWSRSNVHVLMHLDTASVNVGAPGVNRTDNDFALAWTRAHGQGRVFYTALGHRPEIWQDSRFQQHVLGGILWALGTRPRRAADINGDGRGDLLWQTDATGQLVAEYMGGPSGATVLGTGEIVLILNPVPLAARPATLREVLTGPNAQAPVVPAQPLIMVVDDSLTVRKITGRLLSREGYIVITARDGVEALELLAGKVPDVMLVDVEMPRMDGFDLTRNVRADERLKAVPIIMITSRTADKHRNFAMALGVNVFLGKPYREDELLGQIAAFVARS